MVISLELAEICGIHAGDGYMRMRKSKKELQISGSLEEQDYYDSHVVPLFNKEFKLNLSGKNFSNACYGLIVYGKIIPELLNSLGFPYGCKSTNVRVPKEILQSNDKLLLARFLRGLFDTDGHLGFRRYYGNSKLFKLKYNHYPLITLATVSEGLANDVSIMLNLLEIKHFNYNYLPKKVTENRVYIIGVNGVERVKKWLNVIGTKNKVKLSRYLVWEKFGFCPSKLNLKQREDILNGNINPYNIGP
jgi:intein/homing endonuclease